MGTTFLGCINLSEVYSYAPIPPTCNDDWQSQNAFTEVHLSLCTLHVPVGSKPSYSIAQGWKSFGNIIDDLSPDAETDEIFESGDLKYKIINSDNKTVSVLGLKKSVENMNGILVIPETVSYLNQTYSVTSIEDFAFYYSSISNIKLPASINSIGNSAFANNTSITTIKLTDNLTAISTGLFSGCTNLEKIYFPNNLKSIGASSFSNCNNLRSLILPEGVKTISPSAFLNCTSINEILIPNSVEDIGESAFMGCSALKNINLGIGLYSIGNYAFAECPDITDIHCMAENPPFADAYTFPIDTYTKSTVTVQEQSLSIYNRDNPWYRFQNYLTVSGTISLSHYVVDMAGNEVFQLGVYGNVGKIDWYSSNPNVAYVNRCGLIVAKGITGSTVITASVNGEQINCRVTVSSPYRDPIWKTRGASDEEENQPVDIIIESVGGNPPMVNARLIPVGSCTVIDWTSSNSSLASVENGLVTIHGNGDVEFGVKTENGLKETIGTDTNNIDTTGVEEIIYDYNIPTTNDVYDLTGCCILKNADPEQIKGLANGIYIMNGKKILVK